jgi:CheY-like chemotaxis protein
MQRHSGSVGRGASVSNSERVLVVEDDGWIRAFMCDVLSDEGYEVIEAADGRTAIRLAAEDSPDIMLLDYAMPDFTGIDVLRHLRSARRTRSLPVIVVSAYSRVLSEDKLTSVARVLVKPVEAEVLLSAVQRALEPGRGTGRRRLLRLADRAPSDQRLHRTDAIGPIAPEFVTQVACE